MLRLRFTKSPLLSQTIRQLRYKIAVPFISGSVLDVGCGGAYLIDFLPPLQTYVGIDHDPLYLEISRRRSPRHQFYQLDIDREPLPAELAARRFDTITMFAVLEHLAYPQRVLQHLAPLLTPTGRLLATTPTPLGHRVHRLGSYLGLFNYEAVEEHQSILDATLLREFARSAGLRTVCYKQFEFGCNQLIVAAP